MAERPSSSVRGAPHGDVGRAVGNLTRWLRGGIGRADRASLGPFLETIVSRLAEESALVCIAGRRDGTMSYVSPAAASRLGVDARAAAKGRVADLLAPESRGELDALLSEGRPRTHVALRVVDAAGAPAELNCSVSFSGDRFILLEGEQHRTLADVGAAPSGRGSAPAQQVRESDERVRDLERQVRELERALETSTNDAREALRRTVRARDEERSRVRRDLHDGAQQQLLALGVHLDLAAGLATQGAELHDRLLAMRAQVDDAIASIRAISQGIYPAALSEHGIVEGLRSAVHGSVPPVDVRASGIGRYPAEVEATVYFSCLEAIQNAVKHAGASRIVVDVAAHDHEVAFSVSDDGHGFPAPAPRVGVGLRNVADRVRVLGGTLRVESSSSGTTVAGRVPLPAAVAGDADQNAGESSRSASSSGETSSTGTS